MEFIIEDEALLQPFICEVGLEIIASKGPSPKGGKPNPGKQSKLTIPPISDGTHLQGEEGYQEGWTKETALIYVHDEDNPQFIYNRDNVHLQRDQKNLLEKIDPKICERRFSIGLAFVCLSIADGLEDLNKRNNNENTYDIEETIKDIAQSIAPVINPIIDSLSNAALQEAGEDE